MGILDYFFKKKQIPKTIENTKISFEELPTWLNSEKSKISIEENKYLTQIKEKTSQFTTELENEIPSLKQINLEEKKVEEKIKLIVQNNLDNYIKYLEKLTTNLNQIQDNKELIAKINYIFTDFQKKSKMSYEKATFIIGDELGKIKDKIQQFYKDIEEIIKENQTTINKSNTIQSIENEIDKLNTIKKVKSELEENIEENNEELKNLNENLHHHLNKIEEVKTSEKFLEENKKKHELEKKLDNLRQSLDFKALTNFYHIFENEMEIVKSYKENFKQSFNKSNGEDLSELLLKSKLDTPEILNTIQKINEKKLEIEKFDNNEVQSLETEKKKITSEIENINSKKSITEKKSERLNENLSEINNSIKEELVKININLK
jgi:chromosome segregation ATPase